MVDLRYYIRDLKDCKLYCDGSVKVAWIINLWRCLGEVYAKSCNLNCNGGIKVA